MGGEGIISKKAGAPYRGTRTRDWLKIKCIQRQEFVIVGWSESDKRRGFRSLLLAVKDKGKLTYAGKVGTGFNAQADRRTDGADGAARNSPRRRSRCRAPTARARTGSSRSSSPKSPSASSPTTGSCATRASLRCARTSRRRRSCAKCRSIRRAVTKPPNGSQREGEEGARDRRGLRHRDQQPGTRDLPRARPHQEGPRRLLCDDRAADHGRRGKAADDPDPLSRRPHRRMLLPEARQGHVRART